MAAKQLPRLFQAPMQPAATSGEDVAAQLNEQLSSIDAGINKLVDYQQQEIQEKARQAMADEEAAMEARNQFAPLSEINQSLKDIKKLLSDTQRQAGKEGGGGGKGMFDSLLGGLAGLIGGRMLGRGGAGKAGTPAGGGWGLGRILKATAGASLGSMGGGALGEMLGGETGKAIGEIAGGALGAIGLAGIGRRPTTTAPAPAAPVPVSRPPVTPAPPVAATPAATPTPPRPAGMTEAQKAQYDQYRKEGMPAAEAKEKATKSGFERYASREQAIQGAARPTPVPTVSPTPPTVAAPATPVPAAPGTPPVAAPTTPTTPGKTSVLGKIASAGGKAVRFIPGVGQAIALGAAAYESGKAAMNAEEVLGIQGRQATWGERAAAGAGGLAESLSFGILSKEKTAGLLKAATGAGKQADAATSPAAPAPAMAQGNLGSMMKPAPATGNFSASAPNAAPTGTALTPPTQTTATAAAKPKMSISGEQDIKNMIIKHEGIRYEPYKDSLGLWTVGVGHLIGDGKSLPPQWNRKFSHAEVMAMFEEDYAHHKKAAEKIPGFNNMNKFGQGALTDLTFNMGPAWINKWPTLRKQLGAGDLEGAASNLEGSKWYQQVKSRGPTIVSMIRAGGGGEAAATPATPSPSASPAMGETKAPVATAAAPATSGAPQAAPAATPVTTESGTNVTTESGAPVTTGGSVAVPQGPIASRGGNVAPMSERVAVQSSNVNAPVIVNNNSPTTVSGAGGGGGRGIPSPNANRGSLGTSTSFVAAA